MDKKKILIVPSDLAGVGHFRSIWPAQQLQKDYSDRFIVEINPNPNINNIDYLKQFDIIHFHRQLGDLNQMPTLFPMLQNFGVTLIMDIDDYWEPPKEHPLYLMAIQEKIGEKITSTFKYVDYVTTTTNIFAKHIINYNKNVHIIPNGIDMSHKMWQDEDVKKDDKIRIGWAGGSSHRADLLILKESMNILHNDESVKNKYQMVLCGFDIRGTITHIDENQNRHTRKIEPHETCWNEFEQIMTDNYNTNIVSSEYKNWLLKYKNQPFSEINNESYNRRWTLPLTQYGKHYNNMDVCLAPLVDHTFNEVKSELKIIEAGLKKKIIIAQDYSIYKELLTNGENGLLIPRSKINRDWYESIKKVISDKDLREKLSNNLYDFVKDKYTLEAVTKTRVEFYEQVIKNKELILNQ